MKRATISVRLLLAKRYKYSNTELRGLQGSHFRMQGLSKVLVLSTHKQCRNSAYNHLTVARAQLRRLSLATKQQDGRNLTGSCIGELRRRVQRIVGPPPTRPVKNVKLEIPQRNPEDAMPCGLR